MTSPVSERRLLFTAQASSRQLALDELAGNLPGSALEGWLSDGVGALYIPRDWDTIVRRIKASPPVFCRHVCPASYSCDVSRDHSDINRLVAAAQPILARVDPSKTVSVQTRLLGEGDWPYGRYDVNQALASACEATGVTLDVRQPEQILSVAIATETAYLGLSLAADNLSNWSGGEQRFRREREQISRAEFKLLEALSVFALELPQGGRAPRPEAGRALPFSGACASWPWTRRCSTRAWRGTSAWSTFPARRKRSSRTTGASSM